MAAGLLTAADAPDEAVKKEKQRLQGTWVVESAESEGEAVADLKGLRLTFSEDNMVMVMDGKEVKGTYKVDLGKSPKRLDLIPGKEARGSPAMEAVYQLKGDELRMCTGAGSRKLDESGKVVKDKKPQRPKHLDSKEGVLMIFKREKK
jgi:uncharacterized protein (TIGR03067 family)